MSTDLNIAKQAIHDKLESQIKAAEAKLETLKARAEAAKANVEIKAIAELLPKKVEIRQKLEQLKKSGGDRWEQAKADLEGRIADFEKSVKGIESKAKAS
jgi:multidrug resistance efflux pump